MLTNVIAFLKPYDDMAWDDIGNPDAIVIKRIEFEPEDITDKENGECIMEQVHCEYLFERR